MQITVKRNTKEGLKDITGELYELYGYQFCIGLAKEVGYFMAIELYTGFNFAGRIRHESYIDCVKELNKHSKYDYYDCIHDVIEIYKIRSSINKQIKQ